MENKRGWAVKLLDDGRWAQSSAVLQRRRWNTAKVSMVLVAIVVGLLAIRLIVEV